MKFKLPRLRTCLFLAGGAAVIIGGLLQAIAAYQFSAKALVGRLEAGHNCRAEITSTRVSLFGFPGTVEITGLKIAPRDQASEKATPLAERGVLTTSDTMITVDSATLEINFWNLLTGKADVRRAHIHRPDIRGVRSKKGVSSIRSMLGKPKPLALAEPKEEPKDEPATTTAPAEKDEPFNISELPLCAVLGEARISDGSYSLRNDKKRTWTEIRDINFKINGLHLDPAKPADTLPAAISAGAKIVSDNQRLNVRTLEFIVSLEGTYQLFDPATGSLNSDLDFSFTVKKGSIINRIPTLEKLAAKLDGLKTKLGLDLGLQPEGVLTRDLVIKSRLKDGNIRFEEDIIFPFDTYRIKLEKGSWLSLKDDQHRFDGKLMASEAISKKATTGAREFLAKKSPKLAGVFEEHVLKRMLTESGNLSLPFISTEEIGHPEVNFSAKFEEGLKQAMLLAGKDMLLDAAQGGDALENFLDILNEVKKKP